MTTPHHRTVLKTRFPVPNFIQRLSQRQIAHTNAMLVHQPFISFNTAENTRPEHHTAGLALRGRPEVMSHVSGSGARPSMSTVACALLTGDLPIPDRPVRLEIAGQRYWLAPGQRTLPPVMIHGLHLRQQGHHVHTVILNEENESGKPRGSTRHWRDPAPRAADTPVLSLPPLADLNAALRLHYPGMVFNWPEGISPRAPFTPHLLATAMLAEFIARLEQGLAAHPDGEAVMAQLDLGVRDHACFDLEHCPASTGSIILKLGDLTCTWETDARQTHFSAGELNGTGDPEALTHLAFLAEYIGPGGCWTQSDQTLDALMDTDLILSPAGDHRWEVHTGAAPIQHTPQHLTPTVWATELELERTGPLHGAECPAGNRS